GDLFGDHTALDRVHVSGGLPRKHAAPATRTGCVSDLLVLADHRTGMPGIWRVLLVDRALFPKSDRAGFAFFRVGGAKLFVAAVVEKGQRYPLLALVGAGPDLAGAVRSPGRTDSGLFRDPRPNIVDCGSVVAGDLADKEVGDPLRRGV